MVLVVDKRIELWDSDLSFVEVINTMSLFVWNVVCKRFHCTKFIRT